MNEVAWRASGATLRHHVERHPLFTFIVLAYGISWAALLLAHEIDLGAVNAFSVIMAAGPAFSGWIIWGLVRPEPSGVPAGKRWRLFAVLAAMLLGLFALRRMWFALGVVSVVGRAQRPTPYPTWTALVADMLGAAVIAVLLSGVDSSRQGVRAFLHSLDFRTRPIPWLWYMTGIGLYPGIVLVGNALWAAFGGAVRVPQASGPWYWLVADAVLFFLYVLVGGGGLEEPGWRGFALPLLQRRFSPLLASLVLAVIWAFWHWPLFWLGYAEGGPLGVLLYAIGTTPLAILLTAIYNRSGGSLPAIVLLHASFNITSVYLVPSTLASALWVCLVLAIVVIDRMWVKRPPC